MRKIEYLGEMGVFSRDLAANCNEEEVAFDFSRDGDKIDGSFIARRFGSYYMYKTDTWKNFGWVDTTLIFYTLLTESKTKSGRGFYVIKKGADWL